MHELHVVEGLGANILSLLVIHTYNVSHVKKNLNCISVNTGIRMEHVDDTAVTAG